MEGTYLTMNDIVSWIDEWHSYHPTYTEADVAAFAEALNGKIGQMDFRASNGGIAIGYAGVIGESGYKSGVFNTVSEIVEASNGQYSFINMCAENIQNQPNLTKALQEAVGLKNTETIMGVKWLE